MEIPAPKLRHAFRLRVDLGAPIELGQGRAGVRRIIPIIGGKALGPDLTGEVLNLGAEAWWGAPGGSSSRRVDLLPFAVCRCYLPFAAAAPPRAVSMRC